MINNQKLQSLIHEAITSKDTLLEIDGRDAPLYLSYESAEFNLKVHFQLPSFDVIDVSGRFEDRELTWDFFTIEETCYMSELAKKLDLRILFKEISDREDWDYPSIKWGF